MAQWLTNAPVMRLACTRSSWLCLHIADNEMVAGDRLPPERELAANSAWALWGGRNDAINRQRVDCSRI